MYVRMTAPLFDWKTLEDRPSLRMVEQLLAMIPDGKLVESLRAARGRGRDDYPITALLGVVYLTVILRHPTFEACLADLSRNADLRRLIGIDSEARVKQEIDLRRFPPIPRATKQFERRYKGRTAVERVNARVKVFWGADDDNIRGAARFHAFIGVVMVVHLAFATVLAATPRRFGALGQMRLGPVQKALQQGLHPS
jgi:hypothetical protein